MGYRTIQDLLRSEYFDLLPRIRSTTEEIETEVRYLLMPIMRSLESHERIVVKSRVKDCESAIAALLRRRPEYRITGEPDVIGSTVCATRIAAYARKSS